MIEAYSLVDDLPYIDPWSAAPEDDKSSTPPVPPSPTAQRAQAIVERQGGIVPG